jgi:hypothetical protein
MSGEAFDSCRGPSAKGLSETGGWHNRLCYGLCQAGKLLEQFFCSLWLCLLVGLAAVMCSPGASAAELCASSSAKEDPVRAGQKG